MAGRTCRFTFRIALVQPLWERQVPLLHPLNAVTLSSPDSSFSGILDSVNKKLSSIDPHLNLLKVYTKTSKPAEVWSPASSRWVSSHRSGPLETLSRDTARPSWRKNHQRNPPGSSSLEHEGKPGHLWNSRGGRRSPEATVKTFMDVQLP